MKVFRRFRFILGHIRPNSIMSSFRRVDYTFDFFFSNYSANNITLLVIIKFDQWDGQNGFGTSNVEGLILAHDLNPFHAVQELFDHFTLATIREAAII